MSKKRGLWKSWIIILVLNQSPLSTIFSIVWFPEVAKIVLPIHYSQFVFGLFKNCIHLKTVLMSFFAIKIIICIHVSSFRKVLKKFENWQPAWFQMNVWYTIWKYTWLAIILAKKIKIQNSYFAYSWTNGPKNGYSDTAKLSETQKL